MIKLTFLAIRSSMSATCLPGLKAASVTIKSFTSLCSDASQRMCCRQNTTHELLM
jgi:hypothetical protein